MRETKVSHEVVLPHQLVSSLASRDKLSFAARGSKSSLFLALPSNGSTIEENNKSTDRAAGLGTHSPGSISVSDEMIGIRKSAGVCIGLSTGQVKPVPDPTRAYKW